jgi:hypothetical protein
MQNGQYKKFSEEYVRYIPLQKNFRFFSQAILITVDVNRSYAGTAAGSVQ